MLLEQAPVSVPSIIVIGAERAVEVAARLRNNNIKAEIAFQNNLKNALKYANRMNAKWAIIANADSLQVKNLEDGSQREVDLDHLATVMAGLDPAIDALLTRA
jgi:histidyl-tRNA synthetase